MDDDVETLDQIVDMETLTLCRLCTESQGKFQIGPRLQQTIKDCFDITIKADGMSQIICTKCKIIVNEIAKVRETFREKQFMLLERRKNLLNQEVKDSVISVTSTSETKNPSALRTLETKIEAKSPSKPIEMLPKLAATSSEPIISDCSIVPMVESSDQVPSISSSERISTPVMPNNKSSNVTKDNLDVTEVAEEDLDEGPVTRHMSRFNCMLCNQVYINKNQLKRHRLNFHTNLTNLTYALTIPCSIKLDKYNPSTKSTLWDTPVDPWVQINSNKMTKFNHRELFHYQTKSPTVKKLTTVMDSSSDEEIQKPKRTFKRICSIPISTETSSVHKYSDTTSAMEYRQSDSEILKSSKLQNQTESVTDISLTVVEELNSSSDDEAVKSKRMFNRICSIPISVGKSSVHEDSGACQSDSETSKSSAFEEKSIKGKSGSSTPKESTKKEGIKPPPSLALSNVEINKIVRLCWKTAQVKKSITAPVSKNWILEEINAKNYVDVNWVNSKIVRISKISGIEKDSMEDDFLSLPLYTSVNRTSVPQGHQKFLKIPTETQCKSPPKVNHVIVPKTYSKQNDSGGIQTRVSIEDGSTPILVQPGTEMKTATVRTVSDNIIVNKFRSIVPNLFRINSKQNESQEQVEDSSKSKSEQPNNKLSNVANVKRISESNISKPAKKVCTEESGFTVNESCIDQMSPIIVSTVSLAPQQKVAIDIPPTSEMDQAVKPMIKCKPTASLLAQPQKGMENNSLTPGSNMAMQINPNINYLSNMMHMTNVSNITALQPITSQAVSGIPSLLKTSTMASDIPTLNNIMFEGQTARPLLQDTNLLETNQLPIVVPLTEVLTGYSNNIYVSIPPMQPSLNMKPQIPNGTEPPVDVKNYINLKKTLLEVYNIKLVNQPVDNTPPPSELVRFVLTIKEKNVESLNFITSEFLVELGAYPDGVLLLNIRDKDSRQLDVCQWSDEFQMELVKSLKKDNFLNTMLNVSSFAGIPVQNSVKTFASLLDKF